MNICSPVIRSLRSKRCLKHSANSMNWGSIRSCSTASSDEESKAKIEEIVIPTRIQRGPTDILEALSGTIGRDPTAAHYKYHDDPYLMPMSNNNKRIYALAQESGRKAAHWLKQEHREYFLYTTWDPPMKMKTLHKNADPFIDAFSPRPVYNENTQVTEEDLKLVINNSLINDAKTIYNILESKNVSISDESRQQLLELLCFFNEDEPLAEDWYEERWYTNANKGSRYMVMWKEGGLIQTLFDKVENKTPEMYCAIIQGMCKYYQAEKAYNLYKECLEKNITLNTGVYNGLLRVVGFLKEGFDLRWKLMLELITDMNSKGLKPDLDTLNSALESLSSMASLSTKERALQVYSEFVNKCNVKPSLATWYYMLSIFCKERGPKCDILYSIMDMLSGKKLEICDPKDTQFFVTAMNICRYQLHDVTLAKRIHELLLHESNYNLIGDSFKESMYYRFYFSLHCRHESLDVLMDLYSQLVPHVYCPEPSVMEEVIKAIDTNGAVEYLPMIWSHIVMFGHTTRLSILQMILETMVNHLPSLEPEKMNALTQEKPKTIDDVKTLAEAVALEMNEVQAHYGDIPKHNSVEDSLANIAWDIWTKVEEQRQDSTNKLSWTGAMLGNVVQILVRAERLEDANTVLQKLSKDTVISGIPNSPEQIVDFCKLGLKKKKLSYVVTAASYLSDIGFVESSLIAKEALQVLLNKTPEEIEQVISDIISSKTKPHSEDNNISALLSIAAQVYQPSGSKKMSSSSGNAISSSSSTSSSDESSDEELQKD